MTDYLEALLTGEPEEDVWEIPPETAAMWKKRTFPSPEEDREEPPDPAAGTVFRPARRETVETAGQEGSPAPPGASEAAEADGHTADEGLEAPNRARWIVRAVAAGRDVRGAWDEAGETARRTAERLRKAEASREVSGSEEPVTGQSRTAAGSAAEIYRALRAARAAADYARRDRGTMRTSGMPDRGPDHPALGAEELDRTFQRDARRYDGTGPVY